jgi:hypothetical protein
MPKKKLTKAQVKRKMKAAVNALYDLYLDKFGYGPASDITMSAKKLQDMYVPLNHALRKK